MQALGGVLVVGGIVAIKLERAPVSAAAPTEVPAPASALGAQDRAREPDPLSS
jgi:hypothetical protein